MIYKVPNKKFNKARKFFFRSFVQLINWKLKKGMSNANK